MTEMGVMGGRFNRYQKENGRFGVDNEPTSVRMVRRHLPVAPTDPRERQRSTLDNLIVRPARRAWARRVVGCHLEEEKRYESVVPRFIRDPAIGNDGY